MFVAQKYTALYYECSSTDLELPVIDVHCISLSQVVNSPKQNGVVWKQYYQPESKYHYFLCGPLFTDFKKDRQKIQNLKQIKFNRLLSIQASFYVLQCKVGAFLNDLKRLSAREQPFAYTRGNQRKFDILLILVLSFTYREFKKGLYSRFG